MTDRTAPVRPVGTARSATVRLLCAAAALVVGTMIVLLRDTLLPPRFSYDAIAIQAIAKGAASAGDPAYDAVAAVYRSIGLADLPVLTGLLGFFLAFAVLLVAGRRLLRPDAAPTALLLFLATAMLGAVFLGTYSKDVFVLPIALGAVLPGGRLRWPVLTGLLMVAYALEFRTYWFVVLVAWIGVQVLLARRPRLGLLAVAMLVASLVLAAAAGVALGGSADDIRASSNEYRAGSDDASTLISPIIPGGTLLTGVLNAPLQLVSLLVPLPLAVRGPVYAVLALVIALFWIRTAIAARRTLAARTDLQERSALALLIAFVLVQALFEPDYGSALRHLTPLLPLAVLLWTRARPVLRHTSA